MVGIPFSVLALSRFKYISTNRNKSNYWYSNFFSSSSYSDQTWFYNHEKETFTEGPRLQAGRVHHTVGIIKVSQLYRA